MPKTEWKDREVYDLLRKIDHGYSPDTDEAAMLAACTELDLSYYPITTLPESTGQLTRLTYLDLHPEKPELPEHSHTSLQIPSEQIPVTSPEQP